MLSDKVLRPVTSKIPNPLVSAFKEAETYITPDYLAKWKILKNYIVAQCLHISTHQAFFNGAVKTAPNINISIMLEEFKDLISNSYYFSHQYWRAFYYRITKDKLNPRWLQFEEDEFQATLALLSPEQRAQVKSKAKDFWTETGFRKKGLEKIFKEIQPNITRLCYSRLRYLSQHDPAMYSAEDLKQIVNCELLKRFQASDFFDDRPLEMIGWALRCADNIIHNLRNYAQANKRAKLLLVPTEENKFNYLVREIALSTPTDTSKETSSTLQDSIALLGDGAWDHIAELRNKICYDQLMENANPKIQQYLKIIWGENYNSDFWAWFYQNEPALANRVEYLQENPEAIGPWVQRWLKLPTWELVSFLKTNMPNLEEYRRAG